MAVEKSIGGPEQDGSTRSADLMSCSRQYYLEIVKYWPMEYRVAAELTEKYRQEALSSAGPETSTTPTKGST